MRAPEILLFVLVLYYSFNCISVVWTKWDYDALVPFLWDCLRLPYGAEEVSQILHGFVTGVVNIFWIYATCSDQHLLCI